MIEQLPIEIFWLCMAFFGVILGVGLVWKQGVFTMIAGVLLVLIMLPIMSIDYGDRLAYSTSNATSSLVETVDETVVFTDDYTTNSGWTQVGTLVTVDSGVADKVSYAWTSNNNQRVHKSIGTTVVSSDIFILDFTFAVSAFNAGGNTAPEPILVLTAGTGDPLTATQDMLGVAYRTSTNTGFNIIYKDDGGSLTNCQIPSATGFSTYYLTLERTSPFLVNLYVYTDSGRTVLSSGYPHACAIPSTIGSFTNVQHGHNSALITSITANGDDLSLTVGESSLSVVLSDGNTMTNFYDDNLVEIDYTIKALVMVFAGLLMMFGWWQSDFENPFGDSV